MKSGRLKEVWGKWPGDEPIEELLAMLERGSEKTKATDGKQRRPKEHRKKNMSN
jgi:hypothetical protein